MSPPRTMGKTHAAIRAMGKTHAAIRDEALGVLDATQGQKAALMGDVNCDLGGPSPGAYAWGQALNATGHVA